MSAPPNEGYGQYPGQPYGQYPQQDPQAQPPYEDQQAPAPGAPQHETAAHGKKKKRGYAAGAFDVGSGANVAPGGQTQGGGPPQYGMPQQPQVAPGYGGYPQQDPQMAASQGYQYPAQGYPGQQPVPPQQQPAYGGYPAPDQGYPAPQAGAPGVAGVTQGMAGMNLGGQPAQQPQPQGQAPRAAMNQLYPTDLLNQPFNASELDLPPPPITLPPNVRYIPDLCIIHCSEY